LTDSLSLLASSGSSGKTTRKHPNKLADAIARHVAFERASFHTPGHKGRSDLGWSSAGMQTQFQEREPLHDSVYGRDLTELPGLDDLSDPDGILAELERRAAAVWGASQSIISVNGASAALAASMMALSSKGATVLVPRNAHRSIISGLVLSGLFPIWYEPVWDDNWGVWGPVSATCIGRLLDRCGSELAGLVVVSPTYAGALSPIETIAQLCREAGVPLLVDEAHGSHMIPQTVMPPTALAAGADVVVHSLHKTLSALTQTGILHVGGHSQVDPQSLRSALGLLQSSSPSYPLMASVEQAIDLVGSKAGQELLSEMKRLSTEASQSIAQMQSFDQYQTAYGQDCAHILISHRDGDADRLYQFLCERGIFPEAVLGRGVLFLLGVGSTDADVACLTSTLRDFENPAGAGATAYAAGTTSSREREPAALRPPPIVQILSPRQAMLMPSAVIPVHTVAGRIAAELVAPCPPGVPVVVPGQRIPAEIVEFANLQKLRVVIE